MPSEENDVSQTVPRRGPSRDVPRVGALVIVGSGAALDSLRSPRLVPVEGLSLEIGRRPAAGNRPSLVISDNTVSSLHARVQRASTGADLFIVQDLGSTNGTYLDGRRIMGPAPLRDGAVLFLGSQVLVFRLYTTAELEAVQEDAQQPLAPVRTMSPVLAATAAKLRRLATSGGEILLVGETGVGKEVFATAVHHLSRRPGKLVAINCAAIPRELVESELFGHEKGAHSTAQGRRVGLVESANGGTLFLDEIGDMSIELQSKLLRFLQDKRFTPLGSTRVIDADVRIVAATSRVTLEKGGHLQDAVLGRLGARPITLPPLRDRIEDIGRLVAYFLGQLQDGRSFEPEAFHALVLHAWPLNVRELSKVVSEAEVLSRGAPAIGLEHLPDAITANLQVDVDDNIEDTSVDPAPPDIDGFASQATRVGRIRRPAPSRKELETLLASCKGSVAQVARQLDRQYAVVWRCIQRYGIDANAYRGGEKGNG
jgi:transcriptional regulator with GAF, ATPase, and Fis domain